MADGMRQYKAQSPRNIKPVTQPEIVQLTADALADYQAILSVFVAVDDAESYLAQAPDVEYRRRLLNNTGFIALVAKRESVLHFDMPLYCG